MKKRYLFDVNQMTLTAKKIRTYVHSNRSESPCIAWSIALNYDFAGLAEAKVTLDAQPSNCCQQVVCFSIQILIDSFAVTRMVSNGKACKSTTTIGQ